MLSFRFMLQPLCLLSGFTLLTTQAVVADTSSVQSNELTLPVQVSSATGYRQQALLAPAAITVIDKEQISRAPVSDLGEVFRDIPGITLVDSNVPGMKRLSIRGENSRRVLIKVNGQALTDHSNYGTPLLLDASMIERIEVVRGSASVVHGSNAIGGVVNITTRTMQPGEQEVLVSGGYYSATRGYRTSAGVLGATERIDYRLQASRTEHEDRRIPHSKLENSDSDNKSVSAELGYRFGNSRVAWQGDYFQQSAKAWMSPEPFMEMSLAFPKRNSTRNALNYRFENDNAFFNVIEAQAYHHKNTRQMDNVVNVDMPAMGPVPAVKSDSFSRSNDDLTSQGVQLNFAGQWWADNTTLFGFEYQQDSLDVDKYSRKKAFLPMPTPVNEDFPEQEAEQSTWSLFVQQQIALVDGVEANIGARYYDIESELKRSTERSLMKKDDGQLVGSASLVWQTSAQSSLRFNLAQGYTYPSLTQQFSATPGNNVMNYGNPDLKAEKATTFEVGTRLDGQQLTLDLTLYHSRATDFIDKRKVDAGDDNVQAYSGPAKCSGRNLCFEWFNANKANTTGLELMAAYQMAEWRPYVNVAVQKRELKYATGLSTWDSGLPIYQSRTGVEWQLASQVNLDFFVRSYGRSKREDYDKKGQLEIQRTTTYAEFNVAANYQPTHNLNLTMALSNLTNREYRNPEELPAAERAVDVEVHWRF